MKTYNQLPTSIISPISGNLLELKDKDFTNDEELCIAQFMDDSTEIYDDNPVALYFNNKTEESIYIPYKII